MFFSFKNRRKIINKKFINNKQGQAALEYATIVGIIFIFSIIFLSILLLWNYYYNITNEENILKDFGYSLQETLIIISSVNDGLNLSLTIPYNIGEYDYDIINENNGFSLISNNKKLFFRTPYYNGNLKKGENIILKEKGMINIYN